MVEGVSPAKEQDLSAIEQIEENKGEVRDQKNVQTPESPISPKDSHKQSLANTAFEASA